MLEVSLVSDMLHDIFKQNDYHPYPHFKFMHNVTFVFRSPGVMGGLIVAVYYCDSTFSIIFDSMKTESL